jgi:hypothetical protein
MVEARLGVLQLGQRIEACVERQVAIDVAVNLDPRIPPGALSDKPERD